MVRWECRLLPACLAMMVSTSAPVLAYEILLDLDTDDDPTTIETLTYETSAVVKVVLVPTPAGEAIGPTEFGLGGSCLPCGPSGLQTYGTAFDLQLGAPWVTAPGYDSFVDGIMLLGCASDPGFHTVLRFAPTGGGTLVLDQPIFLGAFNAWVVTAPEGCPQPASNLAAMPWTDPEEFWNYVQLGGPAIAVETRSWGSLKGVYRPGD